MAIMSVSDIEEMEDAGGLEVPDQTGGTDHRADWKIFLPTIIIMIGYGASMLYLWLTGRADSALFRLAALVAGLGVPLLAAHAFLRLETLCVRLQKDRMRFHRGWPKGNATEIPYSLIKKLEVKRGLSGRIFGGGTLIIHTRGGLKTSISDLKDPLAVVEHYEQVTRPS